MTPDGPHSDPSRHADYDTQIEGRPIDTTGDGVAADIYQSAPPAPPLVVQPHGTAGGLADVPKPPRLRTPKARLAPWKESVESIAAPRPKKKRRK